MADYLHPSQAKTLEGVLMRNNIDHVLSIRGVLFVDGPEYAAVINEAGMIERVERLRSVAEVELPLGEHATPHSVEERERWSNKLDPRVITRALNANSALKSLYEVVDGTDLQVGLEDALDPWDDWFGGLVDSPAWSNKLWQPPIEVVYRAILDPLTKEEVGLAYGRNPLHTDAWSYGPEEHMTYSEFGRFVWPVLDDMERHNYGDHHFALVFR